MIFEYLTIVNMGEPANSSQLNKLGAEGWELVAAYEFETDDVKYYFHYIFKRIKNEPATNDNG